MAGKRGGEWMIDSLVNSLALSVGCNPVESNYANLVIPPSGLMAAFLFSIIGFMGGGGALVQGESFSPCLISVRYSKVKNATVDLLYKSIKICQVDL